MTMRKIMIHSDGYGGSGTVILDDDGKLIEQVTGIDIHVEAQRINTATVYMDMVQVNAESIVEGMIFKCPLCEWSGPEHKCDTHLSTPGTQQQLQAMPYIQLQQAQNLSPTYPPNQVMHTPSYAVCGQMKGGYTCTIQASITHLTHVDTQSGYMWSDNVISYNLGIGVMPVRL